MPARFSYKMPFGAQLEDDGVHFRLWAPAQQAPQLVLEGEHEWALPMRSVGNGWFECITGNAGGGSRYRYLLEDGMRVPDPASRFQPAGVHRASEVIDPCAYAWRCDDWRGRPWREAVLYEIHVGTFSARGDYGGVRRKLDYLAGLGVTAIELMPLAAFDGRRNWGYDGVLPFAPYAGYGSPRALKRLVDAAHARGLMMFLDVVYNHFGPSGNYLAQYAPQFFTDREHTPWGDAIDFTRREVRDFFIHNALYWLTEYRLDGLRFDAVDQIRDPGPKHFLTELAETVRSTVVDRHVHLVLENDDNAARYLVRSNWLATSKAPAGAGDPPSAAELYTAQWNDDFHHAAHVIATGEESGYYADYVDDPLASFGRALAEGFVYQGEYSHYRDRARGEPSAQLPPLAFVNFLQNHDQVGNRAFGERLAALADEDALAALTAVLMLAPQLPMLFMGEEWAAPQPFCYFCDYHGELGDAVREGRRREFARFPAFAEESARASIPDPNAQATFDASRLNWRSAARAPARRYLELVRELLAVRAREITPYLDDGLCGGRWKRFASAGLHVVWPLRNASLHLMANLSTENAVPDSAPPGDLLYTLPAALTGGRVERLPPWSVMWSRAQ